MCRVSECWPYQTAKLVLQQLGRSAQWNLTGQRLKRLNAVGWRVPGRHRIAAHADIWTERSKYKYTRPGVCTHQPRAHGWEIPTIITSVTLPVFILLTDLQSLCSEQPGCWAPLRSSVPAAGHRLQMAVNERRENKEGLPCDLKKPDSCNKCVLLTEKAQCQ